MCNHFFPRDRTEVRWRHLSYLYSLNIGRDRTECTVVRNKPLSLDLLYQISITKLLYALWLQYLFSHETQTLHVKYVIFGGLIFQIFNWKKWGCCKNGDRGKGKMETQHNINHILTFITSSVFCSHFFILSLLVLVTPFLIPVPRFSNILRNKGIILLKL